MARNLRQRIEDLEKSRTAGYCTCNLTDEQRLAEIMALLELARARERERALFGRPSPEVTPEEWARLAKIEALLAVARKRHDDAAQGTRPAIGLAS